MTTDRLDASVRFAYEEASPSACHHERNYDSMLFEIRQVVIGEKYLASRPTHKNAERGMSLIAPLRQYPYIVQLAHAEEQSA